MSTNRLNTLLQMNDSSNDENVVMLPINKLDFLQDSPFKIYQDEKKEQLIQSIKDNGIIVPIIVTPIENSRGRYTILSGANRVDAATKLNHEDIKSIIKTNLTEDEYNLIVVETNLFNRSVDDMLPSELAKSLLIRQRSMKQQGKRNDLYPDDSNGTMYQRLNEEYKLSERNIRNYIRITYLCDDLLDYIDDKTIPFRAGVELSYLKKEEQDILVNLINEYKLKISIAIADNLKKLSSESENPLTIEEMKKLLIIEKENGIKKVPFIKIQIKEIKDFMKEEDLPNAHKILIEALKMYYELNK